MDASTLEEAINSSGPIISSRKRQSGSPLSQFAAIALNVYGEKTSWTDHSHWTVCTQGGANNSYFSPGGSVISRQLL